jgi:hypothetical protein
LAQPYSAPLATLRGFSGSQQFQAPAGYTFVLRDLDAYNPVSSSGTYYLLGSIGQVMDAWAYGGAGEGVHQWRGRQVIPAPGHFTVVSSQPIDVTVSGYVLFGIPPFED